MKLKELRCYGQNKKGKECSQLLYKYEILKDEMVVQIKCTNCNTFNILRLPFNQQNYDKKNSNSK